MSEFHMPPCIAGYEVGDRTCNGDPKAESEEDRAPCAFRDRCVAMIKLVELKQGKDPEFGLERLVSIRRRKSDRQKVAVPRIDGEKLVGSLDKVIAKYGIKDGRLANKTGKSAAKVPKSKPSAKAAPPSKEKSSELASWFSDCLQKATGRAIHPVPGDAETGEMYLVDRMEKSNYAACYCKGPKGRGRIAVASMIPNRRSGSLQIRIAADFHQYYRAISKDARERLDPGDFTGKDGHFKVRIMGLDKELAALAAETVALAIEKGIISLPEVC